MRAFAKIVSWAYLGFCFNGTFIGDLSSAAESPKNPDVANVHSITLPHFEPEMPPGPGREEFIMACESCHSPRYITMQPSFSPKQWEETVGKMAKTYGAQIDEEQKQAIVGYLVAIKSGASNTNSERTASADEESEGALAPHAPIYVEKYPTIKPSTNSVELAADLSRGADLFKLDCAGCHGDKGRGDGIIAGVLLRKPANLAATRFSMDFLSQVLWNGVRGTSMPSWRGMTSNDLRAISVYVQSLHSTAIGIQREPTERSKQLFQINCAPCHGLLGDGNSNLAATLSPRPANFKRMQSDVDLILQSMRDGIPGTAMPSWKEQLSESERMALADFVRSFYEP